MALQLKIVGGQVVDGTGRPPFLADVGIADGKIVAIGELPEPADQVLDARGAMVTPGFTDLHTHYDGQASWDPGMVPSILHGVTTCVLGSCGVGFAPVRPKDRQSLIALMEGVEDIPGTALSEGLTWQWESFPQYLDALDFPRTLDIALQVTHDPLRVYVMGERALAGEPATPQDIEGMQALLRQALQAGAVGFSTGRTDNHRAADGSATPAAEAGIQELEGLAHAFHGLDHGVLQAVSDFDMALGPAPFDAEFDVLERMAAAAGGHPLSISLMQRDQAPGQWQRILSRAEQAQQRGIPIRVQVASRAIGVMLGLEATFHPFVGYPSYRELANLPLPARVERMREPTFRARLLAETSGRLSGDGSPIPPLADLLLSNLPMLSRRIFRLGEHPHYEPNPETSLFAEAARRGVTPLEAMYDALLEDDGHELLYFPLYNYGAGNLSAVEQMLAHPLALPGLGDAGAHVGTICDASMSTFLLTWWVKERPQGRIPLERAIRMLAHDTARYMGFQDRGTLEVGQRADINIIDLEALRLKRPKLLHDLPAGGKRLIQEVEGIRATLVKGVLVVQDGQLTGARPGRVLRLGQHIP